MTSRRMGLYRKIFRHLRSKHKILPKIVMMDFEKSARKAAKLVWPNSSIRGCWFHYSQSLRRKAKSLPWISQNIEEPEVKMIMRLFKNLALLDENQILKGFEAIKEIQVSSGLFSSFELFNKYYEDFWIKQITPSGFSVKSLRYRTNNYNEGTNNKLKCSLRNNPNIYSFLTELQDLAEETYNEYLYDKKNNICYHDQTYVTAKLHKAEQHMRMGAFEEKGFLIFMSS